MFSNSFLVRVVACIFAVGSTVATTARLDRLRAENSRLKALNAQLRQRVGKLVPAPHMVEGIAKSAYSFSSFLEADSEGQKPCVEVDDAPGVIAADNNFCLAPEVCQERLHMCKRSCVSKCWTDKYAKNGEPPGAGDLDQERMDVINARAKDMLKQVNVNLDCSPCSSSDRMKDSQVVVVPKPVFKKVWKPKPLPIPKGGDQEGTMKLGLLQKNSLEKSS
jgi:hypothetical protein